jgi:hypothetical protein
LKHTDRYLAYVGVLCGLGALAVAIHERGPAVATGNTDASLLRSAVETLAPTHGPVPSTVVARRLRQDLRLEEKQTATLDQVMEACEANLRRAREYPDAFWRSRLDQRARREAYDKLMAILTREQQEDFKAWLQVPANTNMAGWFACPTDCGCGGS